jgi:hypothetical protein
MVQDGRRGDTKHQGRAQQNSKYNRSKRKHEERAKEENIRNSKYTEKLI